MRNEKELKRNVTKDAKRNKQSENEKKYYFEAKEQNTEAKRKIRKRKQSVKKDMEGNEAKRKNWEVNISGKIDVKFSLKHPKRKRNESRFTSFRFEAKKI
jgi:hypothetical protein